MYVLQQVGLNISSINIVLLPPAAASLQGDCFYFFSSIVPLLFFVRSAALSLHLGQPSTCHARLLFFNHAPGLAPTKCWSDSI